MLPAEHHKIKRCKLAENAKLLPPVLLFISINKRMQQRMEAAAGKLVYQQSLPEQDLNFLTLLLPGLALSNAAQGYGKAPGSHVQTRLPCWAPHPTSLHHCQPQLPALLQGRKLPATSVTEHFCIWYCCKKAHACLLPDQSIGNSRPVCGYQSVQPSIEAC